MRARRRGVREDGQALVLLVGVLVAIVCGAAALGWLAAGLAAAGDRQRAADLAALAGARAMLDLGSAGGREGAAEIAARVAGVARETARRNGARRVVVSVVPTVAPARVAVSVRDALRGPGGLLVGGSAKAVAEPVGAASFADGAYDGALERRQGKPMRPDVALAFDRLQDAATRAGRALVIASAYRTDAEQARLFAAHPDPRWVARPGTSLHRLGTELDLGPPAAYAWLLANAPRFGFVRRYPWEPWHFGFTRSPGSASVGFAPPRDDGGLQAWVPSVFRAAITAASIRHGVGAALLAAQLREESGFDARALSPAGARGIAQFMPGTARAVGLHDPFDAPAAIDAQARHMADLLRRFGSVPLALAAYNAGAGAVAACWCVPPFAETRRYVAAIVALARGGWTAGPPQLVRLVS